ncbi:MAG: tetratricopeptide repeat protein [Bacteroidales bacterium]
MKPRSLTALVAAAVVLAALLTAAVARGQSPAARGGSDRLVLRGYDFTYNLDFDEALKTFQQAVSADPKDAEAQRGLATLTWLHILFQRGVVTVDDYMGRVSREDVPTDQAPPAEADRFKKAAERALALGEEAIRRNSKSADAHYDVGAAVGLMASYSATVEGRVMNGFSAARRAYSEQEKALELDPTRKDAGLIVGTYRYIVGSLPFYLRPFAYLVGFGGDKNLGVRMIEEAARYPGDSQTDAKFALALLYNREGRFGDALAVIRQLQKQFPRNRLLWLEAGATALRAGRPAEAEAELNAGIERLRADSRPRSFGEEALWYYKRGAARVLLGNDAGAKSDLETAASTKGRVWVTGRAHAELGKLADLAGDRGRARKEYDMAVAIGNRDHDSAGVDEATALLKTPYKKK